MVWSPPWLGWPLWNICATNDHGYVPLVVNTSRSFPHSRLITGFVTRLTRRVSLVEQELLTLPEFTPGFSGVRVTRSLVLYICFVDRCLSFCTFLLANVLSVLLRYTVSDYLPLVSSNSSSKGLKIKPFLRVLYCCNRSTRPASTQNNIS
jgi:hypothetical protein